MFPGPCLQFTAGAWTRDTMVNITGLLSSLITANHILSYHNVLDSFGHVSVRNPETNTTFFIALQLGIHVPPLPFLVALAILTHDAGPAIISGRADIGEYHISDGSPLPGTKGGYSERFIHSEILKRYPDINAVVHSHAEDVLPFTILPDVAVEPTYHMAGFLGSAVPIFDIESAYQDGDARDLLVDTVRLGSKLAERFGRNESRWQSPKHSTVLQRGHGFVTVATSVQQVTDWAYYVASNARVQWKAVVLAGAQQQSHGCGHGAGGMGVSANKTTGVQYLSQRERLDTAEMNRWIVFKPWRQWVIEVERSGRYINELGTPPLGDGQ